MVTRYLILLLDGVRKALECIRKVFFVFDVTNRLYARLDLVSTFDDECIHLR